MIFWMNVVAGDKKTRNKLYVVEKLYQDI